MVTAALSLSQRQWVLRALVTALICGVLFWRINHDVHKVRLGILNHLLSGLTFEDLLLIESGSGSKNPALIRKYGRYFEYVSKNIPNRADAYAMVGFCEAQLNHIPAAVHAYQKSLDIGPVPVWVYYNLGILYWRQGQLTKAAECFKNAQSVPLNLNLLILQDSKIYSDVLRGAQGMDMGERLKTTYTLSYYLANMSSRMNEDNSNQPRLRIF
jgi:tetratricopeptide (TPR) repeat protein